MTATVVRVERPTSAQTGNVALVRRDGTIEGFVGGVCAQHSVRLYSLKVIETGEPVLLRILPDGSAGVDDARSADARWPRRMPIWRSPATRSPHEEGTVTVRNPCLSGGAIGAVPGAGRCRCRGSWSSGESPIVAALKAIGPRVGLEVVAAADEADGELGAPSRGPRADRRRPRSWRGRGAARRPRGGHPLRRSGGEPRSGAPRCSTDLRAEGVSEEQVARVDSPAGLEIGARTAAEIALSMLAEVVMVRGRTSTTSPQRPQAGRWRDRAGRWPARSR